MCTTLSDQPILRLCSTDCSFPLCVLGRSPSQITSTLDRPIDLSVDLDNPRTTTYTYTPLIMPGEVIDRPNPQAPPSHIPDVVQQLQVQLQRTSLDQSACDALMKFRRAASYIAAGEFNALAIHTLSELTASLYSDDFPAGQCVVEARSYPRRYQT